MSVTATVSVIALIGLHALLLLVDADHGSDTGHRDRRQTLKELCWLPPLLANGRYLPHPRRCPAGDNSADCRMVPGEGVGAGWVLRYACDLGYRVNSSRVASICSLRQLPAQWLPPLPTCQESSYKSPFLPRKDVCGKPSRQLRRKRRVEGKISRRGALPWLVMFGQHRTISTREVMHWFCAGTLITTRHIVTTANCVAGHRQRPTFIARFDDLNLDDSVQDGSEPFEVIIEKKNIIIHPGFQEDSVFENNIAIVKLSNEVTLTEFVKPICLPSPDFRGRGFIGAPVTLASWGQTDEDNLHRKRRFEPILHEMQGKVIEHDECKKQYRTYQQQDTPIIISDKILCASLEANKSCQGDVGSPLMLEYKGTYFLLGIVATQYTCFREFPRVFTKITMYMDWILINLKF